MWKNFETKTGDKAEINDDKENNAGDFFAANNKKMKIIETIKSSQEFIEVQETIGSIFSVNLKAPFLIWIGGFSVGSITAFVENWIVFPAASYFALIALIFADHISGVCLAYKRNDFQTRKFLRIFWTLLSHTALLYFSMNLSKGAKSLFWLNEGVFVPLVLVNLLSLVKNLALLGFIKKSFAEWLYKKIDVHKNKEKKE